MAFALPDPETTDRDGLVYVGGDLDPATVIAAYQRGLFPWRGGAAVPWYSPDPRGVAVAGRVRASHKTRQHARSRGWTVAFDRDFAGAMQRCATTPRAYETDTWITPDLVATYVELHRRGVAHSVEAWRDGRLAGGLYGIALGRVFFGESMFAREADASKLAFVAFVEQLARWGFDFVDCQVRTEHLARFGAREWPRAEFLRTLEGTLARETRRGSWRFDPPASDSAD